MTCRLLFWVICYVCLRVDLFDKKNMHFGKVVFYVGQSIVFEGHGGFRRVSGPAKMIKKWPREETKDAAVNNMKIEQKHEKVQKVDRNNVPCLLGANRCLHFWKHNKFKQIEGREMTFFEVWAWFLTSEKETKTLAFRKVKNLSKAWQGHRFRHIGPSRERTKGGRKRMKSSIKKEDNSLWILFDFHRIWRVYVDLRGPTRTYADQGRREGGGGDQGFRFLQNA